MIVLPYKFLERDPDIGPFGFAQEGFITSIIKLDELEEDDDDYNEHHVKTAIRMGGAYKMVICQTREGNGAYNEFIIPEEEKNLYPLNSPVKLLYKKEEQTGFGQLTGIVIK